MDPKHKQLQEMAKKIIAGEGVPPDIGFIVICVEPGGPAAYVSNINKPEVLSQVLMDLAGVTPEVQRTVLH